MTATTTRTRTRRTPEERQADNLECLYRIQSNPSAGNFQMVYLQLEARGIPIADIDPKVNVLTYKAWLAKGRQVRKGEKSITVATWIVIEPKPGQKEGHQQRLLEDQRVLVALVSTSKPHKKQKQPHEYRSMVGKNHDQRQKHQVHQHHGVWHGR